MGEARTCRACGSTELQPAGPFARRAVCGHCGRCWEDEGGGPEVDVLACSGCERRGACEACPTWLSDSLTHRHVLDDGAEVLTRPLVYGDRHELAAGFTELSLRSRQLRFFQARGALDPDELEYLTNLDYQNHFALAALLLGGKVPAGIAVGRYLRDPSDPTIAEVAVTVMDEHQRRGPDRDDRAACEDQDETQQVQGERDYPEDGHRGDVRRGIGRNAQHEAGGDQREQHPRRAQSRPYDATPLCVFRPSAGSGLRSGVPDE
jgi:hypothetical protein